MHSLRTQSHLHDSPNMLRFAFNNLRGRLLRSILSTLGLAVAIAGMVGLFSIAGGIDNMVSTTFGQIPGLLVQQRGAPVPLFSHLPAAWRDEIAALPGVHVVDSQVMSRVNVIDGKTIISPPRFLAGSDLQVSLDVESSVYRRNMVAGRFFTHDDVGRFTCIISENIAKEFDKQPGDMMVVDRKDIEVVGVYKTGSLMLDGNIVMDLNSVRQLTRMSPDTVNCFYVEPNSDVTPEELDEKIEELFANRNLDIWQPTQSFSLATSNNPLQTLAQSLDASLRGTGNKAATTKQDIDNEEESPVEVRTAEEWSARFDEFSGDLDIFLSLITTIGVSIALLSIVNTMMMSITERTTEFGILRANGWGKSHIVQLVTLESSLLGVAGGCLGVSLGWVATLVINQNLADRIQLYATPQLLLFGLIFSVAIGVLGGLYPAWHAAQLSPMESIRR